MTEPWQRIEEEAQGARDRGARFPLRAYSERMPPPYVGIKPYSPSRAAAASTFGVSDGRCLDVNEYEQAHDLGPGLERIAARIVTELGRLVRGQPHGLSNRLLTSNPAWPSELGAAARAGQLVDAPLVVICPLALSRTQDDKGNHRWTLFGASHDGPARPFWHGLDLPTLQALLGWAGITGPFRILVEDPVRDGLPEALRPHLLGDTPIGTQLGELRALVTLIPFARLPAAVRAAFLAGRLALVPHPASLIFFEHTGHRQLAAELPHALQIPLLHLFPRVESSCTLRIPQSGWLDEDGEPLRAHGSGHGRSQGHRVVPHLVRTHRFQRVPRDAGLHGLQDYTDKVSVALFSTRPEAVDLYDKPMAHNAQIWTANYRLLLDGPRADPAAMVRAAAEVDGGGRFGYRMYFPPMRAGRRELFWHLPLIARPGAGRFARGPLGYVSAEADGVETLQLVPRLLARPAHVAAARAFPRDPGRLRHTTSHNARKLLDARELLGRPLPSSLARALLRIGHETTLGAWLESLPGQASDHDAGTELAQTLRNLVGGDEDPGAPQVLQHLGTRGFEEKIWTSIAQLAHGDFRQKNDADGIVVNRGRHGGPAATAAHVVTHPRRDLEALGDHLHARYRELIAAHGLSGRAEVLDHRFRWETDFSFPWMQGWARNQHGPHERNLVVVIPGRDRGQAVVMADHYDTAYMEDVFYADRGGDSLRAPSCGADDNHSATTALLLAAEQLLPLAAAGRLERDVWLIHLTGEEFPADCLGARALAQALVERSLVLLAEDGSARDVSHVRIAAAYVLDMIGHNSDRGRDVFQIAPGEGAAAWRLAVRAHRANLRWNRCAAEWNRGPARKGLARAQRVAQGREPPPPFVHLPLHGEIRVEWEPRSALFNTDGQIFSDLGIPVVLFMENYDISRSGYHDTLDTLANIDLDYCAALTAIAIETVADTACAPEL